MSFSFLKFVAESALLSVQSDVNDEEVAVRNSAVSLLERVYGKCAIDSLYYIMGTALMTAYFTCIMGVIILVPAWDNRCDFPVVHYFALEVLCIFLPLIPIAFARTGFLPSRSRMSERTRRVWDTTLVFIFYLNEALKLAIHIVGMYFLVTSKTCHGEEWSIFGIVSAYVVSVTIAQSCFLLQFLLYKIVLIRVRNGTLRTPTTEAKQVAAGFSRVQPAPQGLGEQTETDSTDLGEDEDVQCSVCLESFTEEYLKTPCNHSFHERCIVSWMSISPDSCPICRARLNTNQPAPASLSSEDTVEMMIL